MKTEPAPLPRMRSTRRRSAHGIEFDLFDDVWKLRVEGGKVTLNLGALVGFVTEDLGHWFREGFAKVAAVQTAATCEAYMLTFKKFVEYNASVSGVVLCRIDATMLATWIGKAPSSASVSQLKALFRIWRSLRGKGIDDEVFDLAERMSIPDNGQSYVNILTWDEKDGPYRPTEDEAIRLALDDAFNTGLVTLNNYALFRVFRGTGARPSSIADLMVEDLKNDGGQWFLRIPMKKQRGVAGWRVLFMPWKPLSQGLAHVLKMHIECNVRPHVSIDSDLRLAPIFPAVRAKDLSLATAHQDNDGIERKYRSVMKQLAVVSPVTGRVINGHPSRDRHTYLTMLAMNGCTPEEIAANAGQSSSASCEPYVDATINHFQRMEKLVGAAFIPIADRFLGALTSSVSDIMGDDPILDERANGVGSCSVGGCNAIEAGVAPLACYTCRKFRAWSDAPHADLLEFLIKEVDRLRVDGHATVAETRMPTIIAIGDLLERIRQNEETANG